MSAGVPSETVLSERSMRLAKPASTRPAPSSTISSTAAALHREHALAPAHEFGHLLAPGGARISSGSLHRRGGDVGDERHDRLARARLAPALLPSRARRAPSARNGTARSPAAGSSAALRARRRSAIARSTAAVAPLTTTWPGPLSLATFAHLRLRPPRPRPCARSSSSSPRSAAMAPSPTGTARCMARPRRFKSRAASAQGQRVGRGERRVFAERMAGDEARAALHLEARLRASSTRKHGEARRHQRGLRVGGQHQLALRSLEHEASRGAGSARRRPRRTCRARRRSRAPARAPCRPRATPARKNERASHADAAWPRKYQPGREEHRQSRSSDRMVAVALRWLSTI